MLRHSAKELLLTRPTTSLENSLISWRRIKTAYTRSWPVSATARAASLDMSREAPKVIVITGPTAVGKTAVSLELAHALGGEIISADSIQVYRGLDVGSAKLPESERQGIPHHLIDIIDPQDDFSAGEFFHRARQISDEIIQRGRTPIVVGGTAFYLRWFIYGKPTTPVSTAVSAAAAQALLNQAWDRATADKCDGELAAEEKWAIGVAIVRSLGDPDSASRLAEVPNNYYRLQRVVEILMGSKGTPLAALDLDTAAPLAYDFRCFFLDRPRVQLYRRIDERCETMLQGGMLQECGKLLQKGYGVDSSSATRAIGYRQGLEALQRWTAEPDTLTQPAMVNLLEAVQNGSRQYAQKQIKWARGVRLFQWLDAQQPTTVIVAQILERLQCPPFTGDSGNNGTLDKEQQREMKCYIPCRTMLQQGNKLELLCNSTKELLRTLSSGKGL